MICQPPGGKVTPCVWRPNQCALQRRAPVKSTCRRLEDDIWVFERLAFWIEDPSKVEEDRLARVIEALSKEQCLHTKLLRFAPSSRDLEKLTS